MYGDGARTYLLCAHEHEMLAEVRQAREVILYVEE